MGLGVAWVRFSVCLSVCLCVPGWIAGDWLWRPIPGWPSCSSTLNLDRCFSLISSFKFRGQSMILGCWIVLATICLGTCDRGIIPPLTQTHKSEFGRECTQCFVFESCEWSTYLKYCERSICFRARRYFRFKMGSVWRQTFESWNVWVTNTFACLISVDIHVYTLDSIGV